MLASDLERQLHRGVDRVVGGLEAEDQEVRLAGAGAGHLRLERVEQAAVRGYKPGLRDLAHGPRGGEEVVELDPARGLELGRGRTRTQASAITPRMPSEPISIRSGRGPGARPRQPPALPGPARRDRPHRLDQVVDVGVERREVAAGPGRDPAAQGRVLERLREVAQREAVLAQLLLERRPGGARPGSAPPATSGSTSSTRSSRRRSMRHRPAGRRAAPRPRRRRWSRRRTGSPPRPRPRTSSARARSRTRRAGSATRSGGLGNSPAEAAHEVAIGLAERVRDPLVVSSEKRSPNRSGAFSRGARSSTSSSGTGSRPRPRTRAAPGPGRRLPHLRPVGAWSS